MTSTEQLGSVVSRYKDAYSSARAIVASGNTIKMLGIVAGVLAALFGAALGTALGSNGPHGLKDLALALFGAALGTALGGVGGALALMLMGAIVGGVIYSFGVQIAAQGQMLYAVLDTAVNTSSLLEAEHKLVIMNAAAAGATPETTTNDAGI